jgi:tRNA threonylcarbamoyladenosine biosynthesis protein TsaE
LNISFVTESYKDTFNLGLSFAKGRIEQLKNEKVFFLYGELGSGKTTFVRGFCSNFGLENYVSSPSFTIVNEYNSNNVSIAHIDLYRIKSKEELEETGIFEIITSYSYSYIFVEWPEILSDFITKNVVKITFGYGEDENQRIIRVDFEN